MLFTSINFLLFFPLFVIAFFLTPPQFRLFTLLGANYFFYINTKPSFALILMAITLSTYIFALLIEKTKNESWQKIYLLSNIILITLPLFFFKYFAVFNDFVFSALGVLNVKWPLPEMKYLLPVGISFYTFMAISYTVDVFNGSIKAEKKFIFFATFLSFFPILLSGPIERAKSMLPQFRILGAFDYSRTVAGLKLMLWGFFMKLVVADRIGIYVDVILNNISQHNGNSLLLASFLYPIQIYADFGGYSLTAIGVAKILGFDVMCNFKRPFFAISISEFWRRWHISLISWLTDYVFTPLTFIFRKYKIWGIIIALIITFLISGIWHGAKITFVVWGVMQGIFLSFETLTTSYRSAFATKLNLSGKFWYTFLCIFITYLLFSSSMVFSRMENISDAVSVYYNIIKDVRHLPYKDGRNMLFIGVAIGILFIKEFRDEFFPNKFLLFDNKNIVIRWLSYYFIIFMILFFGVFSSEQFIYYQF